MHVNISLQYFIKMATVIFFQFCASFFFIKTLERISKKSILDFINIFSQSLIFFPNLSHCFPLLVEAPAVATSPSLSSLLCVFVALCHMCCVTSQLCYNGAAKVNR